jgi:thioredoxin-dependent peroxiredoxin
MLQAGDHIPHFSLRDQDKIIRTNSDYIGKWSLIYFYPKDDTPGCTAEACSFRDNYGTFANNGIAVIGISKDTPGSHKKFAAKYHLPFTLLSDPTKEIIGAFGALGPKKFMGKEYMAILRTTFLIDPTGIIKKVYENVTPEDHAEQILSDFQALGDTTS